MKLRDDYNEHGTPISVHICECCYQEFTVCPAIPDEEDNDWSGCMAPTCDSYDPSRDLDEVESEILSKADEEIIEDIRRLGDDPDEVVRQMKSIVCQSIASWRKKH